MTESLKGYRTIIVNTLALLFSVGVMAGLDIPVEAQSQITTGVLAVVNIFLRFRTDTKVGESGE